MRPHISGIERVGFSKQDAFRLLPKVSEANVRWANANHTFLTHKNSQTDTFLRDISPAKLHSTAWVWNPQGISKLVNKVDCRVPCTLLIAIVRAFPATKTFAARSSKYPCHMVCVSKSVPRDIISLSDCRPQRLRSAMDEMRNSQGQLLSVSLSCVLQGSQVRKVFFDGTAFACDFLVEKGCRSQYFDETGLWRNALLVNKKKTGSCRCARMSPVSLTGAAT
jgi:hypothetical protein